VRGSDDQLWHRFRMNGNWSGWYRLGGALGSSPAAASFGRGSDVVLRDGERRLRHLTHTRSGWSSSVAIGGILASSPAIAGTGARRLDVVAVGTDNVLKHRWWER
jgi:hypothetical protein